MNKVTVLPASAVPLIVGVSFVICPLAVVKTGVSVVVSTLILKLEEVAELPAASVDVAVKVYFPSVVVSKVGKYLYNIDDVIDQLPSAVAMVLPKLSGQNLTSRYLR